MLASIVWMSRKYQEFNEKYWDNKLVTPTFKLSRSQHAWGYACCNINKRTKKPYNFILKMSTYYNQPENCLTDTLLHEMIHIYEYQYRTETLQMKRYDYHGYFFHQEAKRINAYGHNVTAKVPEKVLSACDLSDRVKILNQRKKAKGYYIAYLKMKCNGTKYAAFKLNETLYKSEFKKFCKSSWVKSRFDNVQVFHTSDDEYINRRSTIKSYFIVDAENFKKIKKCSKLISKASIE